LARRLRLPEPRVAAGLKFLAERGLLEYRPAGGVRIDWLAPRAERPPVDRRALEAARRRPLARLEHVRRYAAGVSCRRRHLLAYFGEPAPARCGRCDVCLGRHRAPVITPADEPRLRAILAHVAAGDDRARWLYDDATPAHHRDALADWLLNEGLLRLEDPLEDVYALTRKGEVALGKPVASGK
jgi:ATP-dependent DNA helicase RecQ